MKCFHHSIFRFSILTLLFLSFWQLRISAQEIASPPQPTEIKIDPKIFDAYIGQYQNVEQSDLIISFFRDGDKFYAQPVDQPKFQIFPSSEAKFFAKDFPLSMDFVRDASGKTTSLVIHQGSRSVAAKKISDQPLKVETIAFNRTEQMIPMRDGVRLHTVILVPQNQTEPLPFLIDRTPYGVKEETSDVINSSKKELVADGYIFVFQDIRGRYESEGGFIMNRPPRDKRDAKGVDESTDTYDTIDWLVKNIPNNNGRAGVMGVSYDGWLSTMALLDAHPALKAVSPQAPMTDTWLGDDFFHNGAFRESYGYEYVKSMESSKTFEDVSFGKTDAYDWYLSRKTLAGVTTETGGKLPTWNNFIAHPNYDSFWQRLAAERYIKPATVPTLVVGGWWDQEDLFGALATYQALEKTDANHLVFLVEGPWNHGGWHGRGRRLANIDFGSDTSKYFRKEIEAPFFAYYLKGKGNLKQPEATVFETGTNRWMTYDSWSPHKNVEPRNLYLHADGKLSFEKPAAQEKTDADNYISDPSNPVPYRKAPIEATYDPNGSHWYTWLAQDQSFLKDRKDVLSWQTEPLTENVTITGDIIAHLFASTSGTDSDWVVKLIDVYPADAKPANYQMMVVGEIFRGRYRKSFEKPEAITPNETNEYTIDLHGNDYAFLKGHRIMVQVQSSWYPLYDRNPQKFVPNIFLAKETDFQSATQKIFHSAKYPTNVSVSVATR